MSPKRGEKGRREVERSDDRTTGELPAASRRCPGPESLRAHHLEKSSRSRVWSDQCRIPNHQDMNHELGIELARHQHQSTEKETVLAEAAVVKKIPLRQIQPDAFRVEFINGEQAIFKPEKSDATMASIRNGHKNERAAFLVDQLLALQLVPTTVLREIDGQMGSVQEFIPDARNIHEIPKEQQVAARHQLGDVWAFDFIIGNRDRNSGNALFDVEGRVYGIDHGQSFQDSFYSFATPPTWDFDRLGEALKTFTLSEAAADQLRAELLEFLSPKQVDACLHRISVLATELEKTEHTEKPSAWASQNFYTS